MDQNGEQIPPPIPGDVSVILLQNWASMIDGLIERSNHAAEQARIAQHQVHVLSRELTNLRGQIILLGAENARDRQHLQHIAEFTQNALFWVPNMSNEHCLVKEFNALINAYNREHEIDLTADTESDEDQ